MGRTGIRIILAGLIAASVATMSCAGTNTERTESITEENHIVALQPSEPEPEVEETPEVLYEEPEDGMVNGVDILTYEEALPIVKECLIDRETSFSVDTQIMEDDVDTVLNNIYTAVIAPTGVPTEGDYILMSIRDIQLSELKTLYSGARPYVHYDFSVQYYSTKDQENAVGQRINEILLELGVYDMQTDIDKVSAIYQWVTTNVVYDEAHAGDKDYINQYSAYGALFDHTAVCQGICSLTYRMLMTTGIDCRCIIGFANDENHSWNLIKVDGIWYDSDITWDLGKSPENYQYFLKGYPSFDETHFRNEFYLTDEFCSAYPISETDYEYQ